MGLRKQERELKAEIENYGRLLYEKDREERLLEEELYCWDRLFVRDTEENYKSKIKEIRNEKQIIEDEKNSLSKTLNVIQDKIENRLKVIRPILTTLAVIVLITFEVGFWWLVGTERLDIDEDSAPGAAVFWIMMTAILSAAVGEAKNYKKR